MSSRALPGPPPVLPTFVLVPGAGGSAWYWHRLVPELRSRGAEAVAVDLPADDDTAGLAAYADAVVAAAGDARDVVLVAQSMGGLTAPLVCDRLRARLLVLLNAMVPLPGETGGDWWAATGQDVPASDEVFLHDVPAEVLATAPPQRDQSGRPFADPWPLAAWPDVPTVVLAGRDDRFFPPDFQRRVAADRLGLEVEEVPGGHLAALSRPAELAERLVALAG
ncbi:alpha/beta fold hydrolase [Blastococcus sp. URHD0036]|uniref:alpha/beta fold hydrolase n=1 Tax=Blastococcus sp. URHD0036 TaxID=1380356 RepID=UPI00068AABC7|nr:alpha/beta hydrolase [Blastococcus sp. URHD0036]